VKPSNVLVEVDHRLLTKLKQVELAAAREGAEHMPTQRRQELLRDAIEVKLCDFVSAGRRAPRAPMPYYQYRCEHTRGTDAFDWQGAAKFGDREKPSPPRVSAYLYRA
jgi:hypothetical protein